MFYRFFIRNGLSSLGFYLGFRSRTVAGTSPTFPFFSALPQIKTALPQIKTALPQIKDALPQKETEVLQVRSAPRLTDNLDNFYIAFV